MKGQREEKCRETLPARSGGVKVKIEEHCLTQRRNDATKSFKANYWIYGFNVASSRRRVKPFFVSAPGME
jgi:hypothetical protein